MAARNNTRWETHRIEAQVEDARFLLAHGLSPAATAERLGVTRKALEKLLARAGKDV